MSVSSTRARALKRTLGRPFLLVVAMVSASACASLRGAHPVDVDAEKPVHVIVGSQRRDMGASYLRFFPSSLELKGGDGIRLTNWADGEPHAVAFGTAVDDAWRAVAALGPRPDPAAVSSLPAVQQLPAPLAPSGPGGTLPFAA